MKEEQTYFIVQGDKVSNKLSILLLFFFQISVVPMAEILVVVVCHHLNHCPITCIFNSPPLAFIIIVLSRTHTFNNAHTNQSDSSGLTSCTHISCNGIQVSRALGCGAQSLLVAFCRVHKFSCIYGNHCEFNLYNTYKTSSVP